MFLPLPTAKIFYKVKGSGTPVLVIHGFPLDHTVMEAFLEPVFRSLKGFKRIYFDLPTMGRSGATNRVNSTKSLLGVIREFISIVLKDERFIVIGYSYGGYLARFLSLCMPERIIGTILIAPVVIAERSKRNVPRHRVVIGKEFLVKLNGPLESDTFDKLVIRNARIWKKVKRYIVPALYRGNKLLQRTIFEKNYSAPSAMLRSKKRFFGPALFITGRCDSTVGYKDVRKLRPLFPNSVHFDLKEAGHDLVFEQQRKVSTIIERWLEDI